MLKLRDGFVERGGENSITDRHIRREDHSVIDSFVIFSERDGICVYADGGDKRATTVDTIEQAHE